MRGIAPALTQQKPIYLQANGEATNIRVGGAKSRSLMFPDSICRQCNNAGTSRYDEAWRVLSAYLHGVWLEIRNAGGFNLAVPFPRDTEANAIDMHLHFVKLFGCKVFADQVPIDLSSFSAALRERRPHPDIGLNFADSPMADSELLAKQSDAYLMRNERQDLDGVTWLYLIHPVAVKISWIRRGAALDVPGHRWHPRQGYGLVNLSPFEGATEPAAGPEALLS